MELSPADKQITEGAVALIPTQSPCLNVSADTFHKEDTEE